MSDLDGSDEYFDSREVIEAIEELEADEEWTIDERNQHRELVRFRDEEGTHFSDWAYGVTFIRTDEFEEYAKEYAEDIGAISRDPQWPLKHIDWTAAAEDLAQDYTEVTLHGVEYLGRN